MLHKKGVFIILICIITVLFLVEIFFSHSHFDMIWNRIPGVDVLIGFVGAWMLVLVAKGVMAKVMQRKEDYYDRGESDEF